MFKLNIERPPLGVTPRYIWDESRFDDLSNAMIRRIQTGYKIPVEWIEEYNELVERLKK